MSWNWGFERSKARRLALNLGSNRRGVTFFSKIRKQEEKARGTFLNEGADYEQARFHDPKGCERYLTACETQAPLFWCSEPSTTFAHTPPPNSTAATLSSKSCFQVNFILALLAEHPISGWPERFQASRKDVQTVSGSPPLRAVTASRNSITSSG